MERILTTWKGRAQGFDDEITDYWGEVEYSGIYFENYEKEFRIGFIYDALKNKIVIFRQIVASHDDIIPDFIGMVTSHFDECYYVASALDPEKSTPRKRDIVCEVREMVVREPTPEEMQRVNGYRQIPEQYRKDMISDALDIHQAADYCNVDERTIRNRLKKINGDGTPMIQGVTGKGRLTRIPLQSLAPYRILLKKEAGRKKKTRSSRNC